MTISPFSAPSVERMNELLPAFEFVAAISSSEDHAVYVATQKSLDRHVAIKVFAPHMISDEQFRYSFEHTARSMAKLNHINLIGVYNSGSVENMLYLVMEFVPGRSVWRSTKGAPLDLVQTINLLDKVCDGLTYAHEHAILHGRLSLYNVLLNQKLEAKIGNFGHHKTGKLEEEDPETRYQAPELLVSASDLTAQSDVFSLGVMFYELLTGQPYGPGVQSPSELTECTVQIDEVWRKATEHRPSQRYRSVRDFQVAMQEAMKGVMAPPSNKGSKLKALNSPYDEKTGKIEMLKRTAKVNLAPLRPAAVAVASARTGAIAVASARTGAIAVAKASPKLAGHAGVKLAAKPAGEPMAGQSLPAPSLDHSGLVIRIIIIIVLLFAIHVAWDKYKTSKAEREADYLKLTQENEKSLQQVRQEALIKKKLRQQELEQQHQQNQSTIEKPVPEDHVKPPVSIDESDKTLEEIRDELCAGSRVQMPKGTKKNGDDYFYHYPKPMTWDDAVIFAEQYGGHLAAPNMLATVGWIKSNLLENGSASVWIGAGKTGKDTWSLADGKAWIPSSVPSGNGDYVVLNPEGLLTLDNDSAKHPFIIQWHANGKNPGSLEAILINTATSLRTNMPIFPPGTQTFGVRHYFYVPRAMRWQDAVAIAKKSGGHLVVAAGLAESFNLEKMTRDIHADDGIWMGASNLKGGWKWITGETWKEPKWSDGADPKAPESALLIRPKRGLDAQPVDRSASGFIIEWSQDAAGVSPH